METAQEPLLRIDREGKWYYCGEPLERLGLVQLFYTVLNKQPDGYYLTTPVENVRIEVADVPFAVVSIDADEAGNITLALNDASHLPLNNERTLRMSRDNVLYVSVMERKGEIFEARFSRNAYLHIAEYMLEIADSTYVLKSFGTTFTLLIA
ncbi:MAG: DUF1285 domain-containing protein [Candidatus Kapaibacteriota bacterium]|jgi:hypothetical protein